MIGTRFSEKIFVWANGPPFWVPKMAHPHNSWSIVRNFLKFCTMKWVNRSMKIILMIFLKTGLFGQMGHSGPKRGPCSNTG